VGLEGGLLPTDPLGRVLLGDDPTQIGLVQFDLAQFGLRRL